MGAHPRRSFPGIRYGRADRFRAPVPVRKAEQQAGGFGPACPQRGDRYRPQSEDCLFLNAWTPDPEVADKKQVMVYFNGRASSNGSGTDPITHASPLPTTVRDVEVPS